MNAIDKATTKPFALPRTLVVGLGKRAGAANFHGLASRLGYAEVIRDSAAIILRAAPILGGLVYHLDSRLVYTLLFRHCVTSKNSPRPSTPP